MAALQAAAAATSKITGGGLDILIHNAGFISTCSQFRTVIEIPPQEFEDDLMESFRANVVGTFHVLSVFLPLVRQGEVKKMVVTSSGMADEVLVAEHRIAVGGSYAVSKHAVNMLVAKFHAAVAGEGVLVFAMCPGLVDTLEGKALSIDEIEGQEALGKKFAEFAPAEFAGPISPLKSVEFQLKVIERATIDEFGGKFVSHYGNKQWL